MIKNFEEIKEQLKELSEVINKFKSEAVQLRIVELVFGLDQEIDDQSGSSKQAKASQRQSTKKKATKKSTTKATPKKPVKKAARQGAVAILSGLVDDGFFSSPKSIGDIVTHCEHNMARKFKSNEFSAKLGRLVRDGDLKRTKNSDNQYEYQSN